MSKAQHSPVTRGSARCSFFLENDIHTVPNQAKVFEGLLGVSSSAVWRRELVSSASSPVALQATSRTTFEESPTTFEVDDGRQYSRECECGPERGWNDNTLELTMSGCYMQFINFVTRDWRVWEIWTENLSATRKKLGETKTRQTANNTQPR